MNVKTIQKKLPQKSGVYIFLDKANKEIYIGKAKNLRKRTEYYFKEDTPKRFKRMVSEAVNLQHFITETENDALLLEAQLIKEKKPNYNILYRNGRSLYYIHFSSHDFARAQITNEYDINAFGPFISREYAQNLLNALLKIFKLRTCTDFTLTHRKRPCLEYYAHRCSAPCVQLIDQLEYAKNVNEFKEICNKNNSQKILKQWNSELKHAVKDENFEIAAQKRDQIIALEKLNQSIHFGNIKQLDIIIQSGQNFYIERIKDGVIIHIEHRKYSQKISFDEFLFEYYMQPPEYPIIGSSKNFLPKSVAHKKVYKTSLARMQSLLGQENFAQILNLEEIVDIETYDSSHYASQHARCGMVYYDFARQEFMKSKWKIWKSENTANDLEILSTALTRRLQYPLPSIILLDGGITQLNAAKKIFAQHNSSYKNIFAFAKGEKRKGGILYDINGNILLDSENQENTPLQTNFLIFLEKLRTQAHDFVHGHAQRSFAKKYKQL